MSTHTPAPESGSHVAVTSLSCAALRAGSVQGNYTSIGLIMPHVLDISISFDAEGLLLQYNATLRWSQWATDVALQHVADTRKMSLFLRPALLDCFEAEFCGVRMLHSPGGDAIDSMYGRKHTQSLASSKSLTHQHAGLIARLATKACCAVQLLAQAEL